MNVMLSKLSRIFRASLQSWRILPVAFPLALAMVRPAVAGLPFCRELTLADLGAALTSGVYTVSQDLFLSADVPGFAALNVAPGATVAIYVRDGAVFTGKGARGNGRTGGYPAIRVPATSELVFVGGGSLQFAGGDSGIPTAGGNGANGEINSSTEYGYRGQGGAGGAGGGGAAAGIGGAGGSGGAGGLPVPQYSMYTDYEATEIKDGKTHANLWNHHTWHEDLKCYQDDNGGDGGTADVGEDCGSVYFVGLVCGKVTAGKSGGGAARAGTSGTGVKYKWNNTYLAGGGGGGGGGAWGAPAKPVGGGGGGGGGGGAGGGGATASRETSTKQEAGDYLGAGGQGGYGFIKGTSGSAGGNGANTWSGGSNWGPVKGGAGGRGGSAGATGGVKGVYLSPTANVDIGDTAAISSVRTHAAVTYTLSFDDGVGDVRKVSILLGDRYPSCSIPNRAGYDFCGWENSRGILCYDFMGNALFSIFDEPADALLRAKWVPTGSGEGRTIVIEKGKKRTLAGLTLRHEAAGFLIHVKPGAVLDLLDSTISGTGVATESGLGAIYNEGTLFCSNCVFKSIATAYGWGAAYSDRPGAEAVFYGCTFQGNEADEAGAVASYGSQVSLVGCTFFDNSAHLPGEKQPGGAALFAFDDAKVNLANCTVVSNLAHKSSATRAGIALADASLQLFNSVLVGNGGVYEFVHGIAGSYGLYASCVGDVYGDSGGNVPKNPSFGMTACATNYLQAQASTRVVKGVSHLFFKPREILRRKGANLWRSADWRTFTAGAASGDCSVSVAVDQLGDPVHPYVGARSGNKLQDLIDATPAGGTCVVPAGTYESGVVGGDQGRGFVLKGEPDAKIDGEDGWTCLRITAPGAVVDGFTVEHGAATTFDYLNGGGLTTEGLSGDDRPTIRNCRFSNCAANCYGGAAYQVGAVEDCVFTGNKMLDSGGAGAVAEASSVTRCTFSGNSAKPASKDKTGWGGAVRGVTRVDSCTFAGNYGTHGGGVDLVDLLVDCTFTGNKAEWGGAASAITKIVHCRFEGNEAEYGGGALNNSIADGQVREIERSSFIRNAVTGNDSVAGKNGVANYNSAILHFRSSLFAMNKAAEDGVCEKATYENCTFYNNKADDFYDEPTSIGEFAALRNCLLYVNSLPEKDLDGGADVTCGTATKVVNADPFFDRSGGDYHLKSAEKDLAKVVADLASLPAAKSEAWPDLDGALLVNRVNGTDYYYLGCYAAAPFKIGGLVVTGADDEYPNSNVKSSLREVVAYAAEFADELAVNGEVTVSFAPGLFDSRGVCTIKAASAQIDVSVFTNQTLVVKGPADKTVVIDGDDSGAGFRAFRVNAGNRLRVENLTFRDCLGSAYGKPAPGFSGGAILNAGTLTAFNCAFRSCKGGSQISGRSQVTAGDGGAVYNDSGSTALFERCTFADCEAARGGALYNADGSFCTVVSSTFAGNKAVSGNSVHAPMGGAIYHAGGSADLFLAHCTVTGNDGGKAGGGLYVGSSSYAMLSAVDTLVVGNAADEGGDVYAAGKAILAYSGLGVLREESEGLLALDKAETNKAATAYLAGGALESDAGAGPLHRCFPLRKGVATPAGHLLVTADWANAVAGDNPRGADVLLRGTLRKALAGSAIKTDQLGNEMATPVCGAVTLTGGEEPPPQPPDDPEPDPLVVTTPTADALRAAIGYAAESPLTADADGRLTVTFADAAAGATISLDASSGNIDASAFTATTLVIQGPVTIDLGNLTRFLSMTDASRVELRDVTVRNGSATEIGGAIFIAEGGSGGFLSCSNCTFAACSAGYGSLGFGGAIAEEGGKSSLSFVRCVFTGNAVGGGTYGNAIYHECDLAVADCDVERTDIWPLPPENFNPRSKFTLAYADGTSRDFDSLADALASIGPDDAIVLSEGAEKDTGMTHAELAAAFSNAFEKAVAEMPWLSVVAAGDVISTDLNALAIPLLTGGGAVFDFDAGEETVSSLPGNVKPRLFYGLGYAGVLGDAFTVDEWLQADEKGVLPKALTAPKLPDRCFYRVFAKRKP